MVQDWVGEGSASTSTAISKEGGKEGAESGAGGRWQELISWTMSLVVRMSSTCESVTGEGSGFRGANSTGGGPSVGVRESTNLGETYKDPTPWGRGWVRRGESKERGEEAQPGGGRASGV
jgi:hypothetical protein